MICHDEVIRVAVRAAKLIRTIKGLPEENNITILYREIAKELDLPEIHTQEELRQARIEKKAIVFGQERKECPICNKDSFIFLPICPSCTDSEENGVKGVFKSGWKCAECGYAEGKSKKSYLQTMIELGYIIPEGSKKDLGILTITDKGME